MFDRFNLAEVNEIHKELKGFLQKSREGGVSTRWLPLYLALLEYCPYLFDKN